MLDLAGKRVTVMGLGRFGGGVGVTRFLVKQGADVLVTDTDPAQKLADSVKQLADLPEGSVTYRLGGHNVSDFTTCDLVVANPAVKPDNRFLRAAEAAGVPITSEIRLLVERLPNRLRTIGVTGSAGKSTVTAMIGHVLRKAANQQSSKTANAPIAESLRDCGPRIWVGGNIGGSLLESLDEIGHDDWVVLELSSFMLHGLREHDGMPGWSPHIAVVTNISPNHLDWHGTLEAYAQAKQYILEYQIAGDFAVLGPESGFMAGVVSHAGTRTIEESSGQGFLTLAVPGDHNRLNAMMALAASDWTGISWSSMDEMANVLADFPGLSHRLQFVCEHNGVRFFNDSKCTTPEAAKLAIESFESAPGSVHIILGGYDKGSDLKPLAALAAERCAGVYTIGATGEVIATAAETASAAVGDVAGARPGTCGGVAWPEPGAAVVRCGELEAAVREAVKRAKPGQVVLLSPACASWDQFTNFEQRGARFVEMVLRYTGE